MQLARRESPRDSAEGGPSGRAGSHDAIPRQAADQGHQADRRAQIMRSIEVPLGQDGAGAGAAGLLEGDAPQAPAQA